MHSLLLRRTALTLYLGAFCAAVPHADTAPLHPEQLIFAGLEHATGQRFDYPSIVQAGDGSLHATYSYNLKTIKHVTFNESWVKAGAGR
jgi:hypothetical protein